MRMKKTWRLTLLAGLVLGVAGCAVISFFPTKAAERAADKVLDEIIAGNGVQVDPAKVPETKEP